MVNDCPFYAPHVVTAVLKSSLIYGNCRGTILVWIHIRQRVIRFVWPHTQRREQRKKVVSLLSEQIIPTNSPLVGAFRKFPAERGRARVESLNPQCLVKSCPDRRIQLRSTLELWTGELRFRKATHMLSFLHSWHPGYSWVQPNTCMQYKMLFIIH